MGQQNSWRKQSAIRRDTRSAKDDPGDRPIAAKKDTKLWCKGKIGVEHKPKCFPADALWFKGCFVLSCTVCGKTMDKYFPFAGSRRNKPDWVSER